MANEGHMEHLTYYSSTLPKGSKEAENMKWSPEDSMLFTNFQSDKATEEDAYIVQKRLVEMGLLEPHLVDGKRGVVTDGAIRRWRLNTGDDKEMYWHEMSKGEDLFSVGMTGLRNWWSGK